MAESGIQTKNRIKFIALVSVFLLPVIVSWCLVNFTNYGRDGKGVEHGTLIEPPRYLEQARLVQINRFSSVPVTLHGKWSLLFFVPNVCDSLCEQGLYRIRQIRLAMGKRIAQVQRVIIIDRKEAEVLDRYLAENYPGQIYVYKSRLGKDFLNSFKDQGINEPGVIFLVDPRGFLMMRYSGETDPSGIIRDLSRLLRISGDV